MFGLVSGVVCGVVRLNVRAQATLSMASCGLYSLLIYLSLFLSLPSVSYAQQIASAPSVASPSVASQNELTPEERDWLSRHPVITLAVDGRWPPVDFYNDAGQHSGILAEYLQHLERMLGVTFQRVQFANFETMFAALSQGDIYLAAPLAQTTERMKRLWFSDPVFSAGKVIVSRPQHVIDGADGFSGQVLALERGYYLEQEIRHKYPNLSIRYFDNSRQAMRGLAAEKADFYIGDEMVANWLKQDLQLGSLHITPAPQFEISRQAFAVHQDERWQPLVSILNKTLRNIPDSIRADILNRWRGKQEADSLFQGWTDEEQQQLQAFSELTIGVDPNWPPFEFRDEHGELRGLSAEYNELISERLGIPFKPVFYPSWSDTWEAFKRGEIDMISGVNPTQKHEVYTLYSTPYMIHPYMILVHDDTRFVNSMDDLAGKRVAVGAGFAIEDILNNQSELQLRSYPTTQAALIALSAREVDAYIGLLGPSSWILEQYGIRNVKVSAPADYKYYQSIGIHQQHPQLLELVNKAIASIPDYQKQTIKNHWFQVEFDYQISGAEVFRIILLTLSVVFPVMVVILLWNRKLKQTQKQLKQSQQHLSEARDAAENASQFKSQFLANMSHEIRTPMNAIIGMNHLLLRSGLNRSQTGYSKKIKQSATALLGIINDILDFSKVEAGRLDIERVPFNIHSVFSELSDMLALKASEKGIEILLDIDARIPVNLIGDPLRIGQVLINLTQNAIKFTDKGEVKVSVKRLNPQAKTQGHLVLEFQVEDTGIGIEPESLPRLFEPFIQADGSSTRKQGGTGLGLHISRQLVGLMGGELKATSEPGVGSCFYFTLDLATDNNTQAAPQFSPADNIRGLRVLVIDDNPSARQLLKDMLESFSFQVTTLARGDEAALLVKHQADLGEPFGLVIADWQMPGMNGIETLQQIESLRLTTQPARILITAYGREDVFSSADNHGLDALLIKPINASVLFDTIMRLLADGADIVKSKPEKESVWLLGDVLVVEDHEINQAVALELLHSVGIMADTASNGVEAIEAIRQKHYDLVLMDLQMPVMDGLQATAIIRQDEQHRQLPIIAMTAHAMQGDKVRCLSAGMNDHISKPIDPDAFLQVLKQWLPEGDAPDKQLHTDAAAAFETPIVGLDAEWGIRRVGGNRGLYINLLNNFYRKHHGDLDVINNALKACDLDLCRRLVHTLLGVSANLGASDFEKDADEFNQLLKQSLKAPETLMTSLQWKRFSESFNDLFNGIKHSGLLSQPEYDKTESDTIDKDRSAGSVESNNVIADDCRHSLKKLADLLQQGDASAPLLFEEVADELPESIRSPLQILMDDFDFDQAYQLISTALQTGPADEKDS